MFYTYLDDEKVNIFIFCVFCLVAKKMENSQKNDLFYFMFCIILVNEKMIFFFVWLLKNDGKEEKNIFLILFLVLFGSFH